MDVVTLLEHLANQVHYSDNLPNLVKEQAPAIELAFLENDSDMLKKQISNERYFADKTGVARIT